LAQLRGQITPELPEPLAEMQVACVDETEHVYLRESIGGFRIDEVPFCRSGRRGRTDADGLTSLSLHLHRPPHDPLALPRAILVTWDGTRISGPALAASETQRSDRASLAVDRCNLEGEEASLAPTGGAGNPQQEVMASRLAQGSDRSRHENELGTYARPGQSA